MHFKWTFSEICLYFVVTPPAPSNNLPRPTTESNLETIISVSQTLETSVDHDHKLKISLNFSFAQNTIQRVITFKYFQLQWIEFKFHFLTKSVLSLWCLGQWYTIISQTCWYYNKISDCNFLVSSCRPWNLRMRDPKLTCLAMSQMNSQTSNSRSTLGT